jgi:hypothetical protein
MKVTPRGHRWVGRISIAAFLAVFSLALLATPSLANAGLDVVPPGDPSGLGFRAEVSTTQAGAHPEATTDFTLTMGPTFAEHNEKGGMLRDGIVDLPPGVVGNPETVEKCRATELLPGIHPFTNCPPASQVGIVSVRQEFSDFGSFTYPSVPLYALQPSEDQLAIFGFKLAGAIVAIEASVRPGDHGVRLIARNASQEAPVRQVKVTVWGVPGDPVHDDQRCHALVDTVNNRCDPNLSVAGIPFVNSGGRRGAFFTNPTVCDAPKLTSIRVSSWWVPPVGVLSDPVTAVSPTPTGCEKLSFDPTISVRPDATAADAPTGLEVTLRVPQNEEVDSPATAHLKDVRVHFPGGLTISPASAGGLDACSDAQVDLGSDAAPTCPDASKVGSVEAATPVLADPVSGSLYVGTQRSRDPESGELFRVFLVLRLPNGQFVKLEGKVRADARTGRLATTFANNPQLPVSDIHLRLKSGPRAPLATPPSPGEKAVATSLSSWAGHELALEDRFSIAGNGFEGFAPGFSAGTRNAVAGAFSPFQVRVDRADRQEFMNALTMTLPAGLTAKLRGVPLCSDSNAASGTCPAQTRVGTATASAGSGPLPYSLQGTVSLTSAYKGAPYGLVVSVPAVAGPFNLGTVVVRQALFISPDDAHVTVVSDPLPTIVSGVPVRLRSVDVEVNRNGFTLNPTSCARKEIRGVLGSEQGSSYPVSSRFQVGDCAALGFKPKLRLSLTGKNQTTVGRHPGLEAILTQPGRQGNIRRVEVRLPLSLALDPDNANGLCEFEEGQKAKPNCPKSSIIGRVRADTPLLDRPLTGNVYFVKGIRRDPRTGRLIRTLPTLLLALRGQVDINLRATSSVKQNKLVTTFATVPDAPVSRVRMALKGGKGGILVVTGNRGICARKQVAQLLLGAHNGHRVDGNAPMQAPCSQQTGRKAK